ncbi:type IV secretory pathway vird4 component, partial [Sesbania bispinosa]
DAQQPHGEALNYTVAQKPHEEAVASGRLRSTVTESLAQVHVEAGHAVDCRRRWSATRMVTGNWTETVAWSLDGDVSWKSTPAVMDRCRDLPLEVTLDGCWIQRSLVQLGNGSVKKSADDWPP